MSDINLFPGEVLTPACVELLTQLNRYHAGQTSYEDFVRIMEERRHGLELALTQFLPNVPLNPNPESAKVQMNCIKVLSDATRDIATVIPQILEYSESKNEEMYQYLLDRLGRIWAVERATIEQFHMANVPEGPTDMPFVNAVHHAQKRYYAGELAEEAYLRVINKVIEKLQAAYEEIEQRENGGEPQAELLHAYVHFIDSLETVKAYISEGEEYASGLMRDVIESAQRVRDSIKVFTFHVTTCGPTRMIQANLMINMAESWHQGRLEANVFLRALEIFADNLDRTWRQVQALAALPHDSAEQISAYMDTLREAYEEQFQAVQLYREAVGGNTGVLEQALAVMTSGAEKAADCREAFLAMGENVGKIPCMRCGAYNPPGNRNCEKCGARMLGAESMPDDGSSTISYQEEGGSVRQGGGLIITTPLRTLFEAVNAVTEGHIPPEKFGESVVIYRNFIAKNYDVEQVTQHLLEEVEDGSGDLPNRVEELGNELYVAVAAINEALDILEQYVSTRDSQNIFDGVLAMKEGSLKLQAVLDKIKALVKGEDVNGDEGHMAGFNLDFGEEINTGFVG